MDLSLTEIQEEWVARAADCALEFEGRARAYDEQAAFPGQDFERLKRDGFLSLAVPEAFGGNGAKEGNATLLVYLVIRELAKRCPGTAWCLMIHYHQCGAIARLGNDEQRRRVFDAIISNGALMGSLGSEVNPTQFTAAAGTETKVTFKSEVAPVDGGFLANGSKHFCSVAPVSEYMLFWAIAPGVDSPGAGLMQAIIPRSAEGLTFDPTGWNECIGLRCTVSESATLQDVFIPWENVIGQPGDWVQNDPYTLELSQAAHLLGIAEGALAFIHEVLRERAYLVSDDTIVSEVASLEAMTLATLHSLFHAAWLWEEGQYGDAALASMRVNHLAKEVAMRTTTRGFDIVGTRALFRFHPLEMLWRDARTASLHTRESQLQRLVTEGRLAGEFFPKTKYGAQTKHRRSWRELGLR